MGLVLSIFLSGCGPSRQIESDYAGQKFETTCLSCDGSRQTVRVWASGKGKAKTLEQCRKQALRDIIFKGINLGDKSCLRRPLVAEVNAEERYRSFFNEFFAKKSRWSRFAKLNDKKYSRGVSKHDETETWEASVTVDIDALGAHLREQGVNTIDY